MRKYLTVGLLALTLVAGEAIAADDAIVNATGGGAAGELGLTNTQADLLALLLVAGAGLGVWFATDHPVSP